MRTPPADLTGDQLARVLGEAWAFPAVRLDYLPVGFGSHHWVAADSTGARRFVTVDDLGSRGAAGTAAARRRLDRALTTAHRLKEGAGLPFVVAPVPAADGALLHEVATTYAVAVYPFVTAPAWPASEHSTPRHRAAVVDLLADLHRATAAVRAGAGVDDLALRCRAGLERALGRLGEPWSGGPFAEPARAALARSAHEVGTLLRRYDRLVDDLRARDVPWVVTHGEPKPDNLLDGDAGPLLVDWDTTLLAPAARDLWMVDGPPDEVRARYADRTGRRVRPADLTLYRLGWDLGEIGDYVRWLAGPHSRTPDTETAWAALHGTLRLRERWPDLL